MAMRFICACMVLMLFLGYTSCQKLEDAQMGKQTLKKEQGRYVDAIAADYGRLVGVTSNSKWADWAQLWFERPDSTLVVVYVNFIDGKIANDVLVIPRR